MQIKWSDAEDEVQELKTNKQTNKKKKEEEISTTNLKTCNINYRLLQCDTAHLISGHQGLGRTYCPHLQG